MSSERTFGDSTAPGQIPLEQVQGVCLYSDGLYAASEADVQRFRDAGKAIAFITVYGEWQKASILDVETGDATPSDAPLWIRNRNRFREGSAIIYANKSTWPEIEARCAGLTYWRWVADPTGEPHSLDGVRRLLAVQWGWFEGYDLSLWLRPHVHPDPLTQQAA